MSQRLRLRYESEPIQLQGWNCMKFVLDNPGKTPEGPMTRGLKARSLLPKELSLRPPHISRVYGKFEPKVLVWCAISEAGVSTPFIGTVKGQAVDADVYITKCLPKIVKFMTKKLEWFEQNNIQIVSKKIFLGFARSCNLCQRMRSKK
jgi:hypothetical protein